MTYNKDVGVLVEWEYWPKPKGGTQDDPIYRKKRFDTIDSALSLVEALRIHYETNLRIVNIILRLYPTKES